MPSHNTLPTARTSNSEYSTGNSRADSKPTSSQPLHIALVGYRSHPHVGGQGIYIKHLATALTALGHKVTVISGPPYPDLPEHVPLIRLDSLDLYAKEKPFRALKLKHLRSYADMYEWFGRVTGSFAEPYAFGRRLHRHLAQSDNAYDVLHDNQTLCTALLNLDLPVVATVHHPITRDREQAIAAAPNWLHRWGAKRWYSFVNMQAKVTRALQHVVTVSQSSQQDIEACFGRPAEATDVIFNGIDTDFFKPLHAITRAKQTLLTTCSSDQPVKGFAILIEAFAALRATLPNIQLMVIGQLKPKGNSARLLSEKGLSQDVIFQSNLSDTQMVEAYNSATVYVCPSLYEGFGLPVAEAMSCGTPVVSSDGGALPEVIGDAGIIVPAGNAEALAAAISELIKSEEQQSLLAHKGRERALASFCWQHVAAQYVSLYQKAIGQHANGSAAAPHQDPTLNVAAADNTSTAPQAN